MHFVRYHTFTCEIPLGNKAQNREKGQVITAKFGGILLYFIYCSLFRHFFFQKHPSGIDTIFAETMFLQQIGNFFPSA